MPLAPSAWSAACRPHSRAHLRNQEEPYQVAQDRDGQNEELPPPALPELTGEHVHGGCHQALHTDKLQEEGSWGERHCLPLGLPPAWLCPGCLSPHSPMLTHRSTGGGTRAEVGWPALPLAASLQQRVPAWGFEGETCSAPKAGGRAWQLELRGWREAGGPLGRGGVHGWGRVRPGGKGRWPLTE